jgi:hypothetical protein
MICSASPLGKLGCIGTEIISGLVLLDSMMVSLER